MKEIIHNLGIDIAFLMILTAEVVPEKTILLNCDGVMCRAQDLLGSQ